jgi:hypothetical protein
MFRSLKGSHDFAMGTTDDGTGRVRSVLFDSQTWQLRYPVADDENWIIQYLAADTRNRLPEGSVQIRRQWGREISWDQPQADGEAAREQAKNAPA